MKKVLLGSIIAAASLFGDVIDTKQGLALELYVEPSFHSEKFAQVLVEGGDIQIRRCVTKGNDTWCKVRYISKAFTLNGYSDKKSLDKLHTKRKKRDYFEAIYGGRYLDEGADVIPEKDGGFTVIGSTESYGNGSKDIYLIRTDKYGNKIKSFAYGGRNDDIAKAALRLKDGSTIIVGDTESFGNRARSIYVGKVNKKGYMQWQKGIYNDKDDYYSGESVAPVSDKSFLIAGMEDHVQFFDSEVNGIVVGVRTNSQAYAIRYFGGEDDDTFSSIIALKDGYIMAGKTETWGHGDFDAYVVKIDKEGIPQFARAFGYKYNENAKQIIRSNDGGFILIGTTDSDYDMKDDIFVVKMDAKGNRLWQYHYGTREEDRGYSITRAHGGGYILAGYTKDTKGFDKDVYLMKIDEDGSPLWERRYGGARDDVAYKIKTIPDGYVVVGYKKSPQNHSKDVYLLKLDKNGRLR